VTAPEGDFPWCQGTWWDCLSALMALSRTATQRDLAARILKRRAAKGRMDTFGIDRMRFRQIEALARLIGASDADELATAEAARLEATSTLVCALADASRATFFALQDPLLARRTFATVPTPGLRNLTVEDVTEVFDYERLGDAASVLATALLGSAAIHDRFDDLRIGMRLMGLCADGRLVDTNTTLHLVVATAQALLSVGCVSSLDISTRVSQLQLFSTFLPATGHDYGDPDVQALAEEIAHIDADRFAIETVQPHRESVIERLQTAFRASRHWAYLDDLIAYCDGARTGETVEENKDRLNDLAVFQSWRALIQHSLADHNASITTLRNATSPGQSSTFIEHASRSFLSNRAPYLQPPGLPLHEEVRDSDSRDINDDEINLDDAPPQVAVEAAIIAIRERMRNDGVERAHRATLQRAMLAAKAAEEGFAPNDFLMSEARAYGVIAYALYKADETPKLDESALAGLTAIIGEPRATSTPYETALDAALTLLAERHDAFPVLRRALGRASALAHTLEDRDPFRAFAIYQLELSAILENRDVLANQTDASYAMLLATDLLRSAGHLAVTNDDRRSSSRLLAQAAFLVRELAIAFCRFYEPEVAVELTEMVSGIAAGARLSDAARLTDARELTTQGLDTFRSQTIPAHDTLNVTIICGPFMVIVLVRPPHGSWEITHLGTSAGAHVLGFAAEHMGSQLVTLRHYTEQLGDFLRNLWSGAAALTTSTEGPALYLPSGPPLLFASTLLRAGEPGGLMSTPPVVIGSLSRRHADRLAAAVSVPMRVAVLVGRETVGTSGKVDAAKDGAIIGASGCAVTEVRGEIAQGLTEATCIHYAGHLASIGPDETVLALVDGDVAIEGIRTLQLDHVELAVLMACDTSQAPMGYSAEQCEHAAGAFLEAGVGAVVGTLWPVFDRPAHVFTKVFYEQLAHGTPLGRAFDRAVDGVRGYRTGQLNPYAHSAYWGAFTLFIGPGVPADRAV
jgi:CHAT domain-containing protein